eukprot:689813-Rhodomonas_salina.2
MSKCVGDRPVGLARYPLVVDVRYLEVREGCGHALMQALPTHHIRHVSAGHGLARAWADEVQVSCWRQST